MSSADPFSSRFEVFGREPKHLVGDINQQPYEKLKRLLDVGEGGDGRVVLLRAPRAGFGKTSLLQRLAGEFSETHQFVRVNLVSGRTTDATHVLEYVLQALCQVLPDSSTLTILDNLSRRVLALGLEPLVASGEVPCQDREGALTALREQPTETFDFHHDRAVTAHWTKSNFEILGPRLAAELGRVSGASLREASYWVELLFRFSTTAPDNVERARLLFETVFRGGMQSQSESAAEERLHGLLAILGTVTNLVLIVDDTEGLSTHPPDALALAAFLTNLSQCCPGSLVILSVNEDIWESAFLPLLPGGLADRLTEHDVKLRPLTEEQARELVRKRARDRADEVLEAIDWGSGNLYARQVLKAASHAWETLDHDHAPSLAVVEAEGESAEDLAAEDEEIAAISDLDDDEFVDELEDDLDDFDLEEDVAEKAVEEGVTAEESADLADHSDRADADEHEHEEEEEIKTVDAEAEAEAEEEADDESEVSADSNEEFESPFAAVVDADADVETEVEANAEEDDAAPAGTRPFAARLEEPAESDEGEEVAAEAEESAEEPVSSDEAQPASPFAAAARSDAEPNPFFAGEPPQPETAETPPSVFAKLSDPPAGPATESRPFTGAAEPEAPATAPLGTGEESASPFEAHTHAQATTVASGAPGEGEDSAGPAAHESPSETAPAEHSPFSAGPPPSAPPPAGISEDAPASASAADDNPFMPKFGQPLAPSLHEIPPATDHSGSAPEGGVPDHGPAPGEGSPFGGPPALPPALDDATAASPPPALPPGHIPSPPPFAAGTPPTLPPAEPPASTFAPPPAPPAALEADPAQSLHQASEELAQAFKTPGDPPISLVPTEHESAGRTEPEQAPAPGAEATEESEAEAESTEPASPFAALGRSTAEKNIGDVSSIFAPIQPGADSTLDPEKLTPLLEDADDASTASPPAPAGFSTESAPHTELETAPCAFTPGAAPPSDNPFSAGAPPAEQSPPPVTDPASPAPAPFSAVGGTPPPEPPAPGAPDAFAPAQAPAPPHSLDAPSAFRAAALGPFSTPAPEPGTTAENQAGAEGDSSASAPFTRVDPAEAESSTRTPESASSPFAETAAEHEAKSEPDIGESGESDSVSAPVHLTVTEPGSTTDNEGERRRELESPLKAVEADTPFKPVSVPSAQDASTSPFAKVEPGPAAPPQRTELPPRKIDLPEPMGGESSPFEPGQPPSFGTPAHAPASASAPMPMAPAGESTLTEREPVPPPAGAGSAERPFESPKPDDSSPFSAIGQSPSAPPPSFAALDSPAEPSGAYEDPGDPGEQDKVDELLRQFKERYGRK